MEVSESLTGPFSPVCYSLIHATSTLRRINLKTQLLPRKRIKCSPSTLIVFKLFRCPHWNAASAPERWPDNLVPRVTWLLWRQRFQKVPFLLSTLIHLAGVFKFINFGELLQRMCQSDKIWMSCYVLCYVPHAQCTYYLRKKSTY